MSKITKGLRKQAKRMPPLNQSLWALLISSLTALLAGAWCTFRRGSNATASSGILNEMVPHH